MPLSKELKSSLCPNSLRDLFSIVCCGFSPSSVNIYPFAKYILVTWEPPSQLMNGSIIDYRLGSKDYANGTEPYDVVVVKQSVGEHARKKVLVNQKPESNYVVDLQARTVIGWGTSVKKAVKTVKWSGEWVILSGVSNSYVANYCNQLYSCLQWSQVVKWHLLISPRALIELTPCFVNIIFTTIPVSVKMTLTVTIQ